MVSLELLSEIGFTKEMTEQYVYYANILDDRIIPICDVYFEGEIRFKEALGQVCQLATEEISHYTTELMFVIEFAKYLESRYKEKGIPRQIFIDSMKDIPCKIRECMAAKGVFGTFVAWWYDRFFDMTRMAFGRLEYDIDEYTKETICVGDYEIEKGDLILNCHIPSAGPLYHELCLDSYKRAYDYFRGRLKGGILAIHCHSWLLYKPYIPVFGVESNIYDFMCDFAIYRTEHSGKFDEWRVFGKEYDVHNDVLPMDTRLQRNFVEYIKESGTFGVGNGILLFDGEKVLTRNTLSD